jgi:hypothetical protein
MSKAPEMSFNNHPTPGEPAREQKRLTNLPFAFQWILWTIFGMSATLVIFSLVEFIYHGDYHGGEALAVAFVLFSIEIVPLVTGTLLLCLTPWKVARRVILVNLAAILLLSAIVFRHYVIS